MKFRIEVTTFVDLPYRPKQYSKGMSPEAALSLELEELSKDPRELLGLDVQVTGVSGSIVQDDATPPSRSLADGIFGEAAE
jgi:hypothetical protein